MITQSTGFTRIRDLTTGSMGKVRGRISSCEVKQGKGGAYLNGTLQDSEGTISFKIWTARENIFSYYAAGKVIECVVKVSSYRDELQITIESEQFLSDEQAMPFADDLTPASAFGEEDLVEELRQMIDAAHEIDNLWPTADEMIEAMTKAKLWEKFIRVPAAMSIHQAYVRGLLEHSVQVARIAIASAKGVNGANIPLVTHGALLHDLGKCVSFTIDAYGLASAVSVPGVLLGHLVIGASMIAPVFKKVYSKQQQLLVAHICVSHHGRYEWGSAILPAFKEAFLVHNADYLDSKMGDLTDAENNEDPNIVSTKSWALDRFLLATGGNLTQDIEDTKK